MGIRGILMKWSWDFDGFCLCVCACFTWDSNGILAIGVCPNMFQFSFTL